VNTKKQWFIIQKTSACTISFCEKVSRRFPPSTNIEDWSELKGILHLLSNSHFDSPNVCDINYLTSLARFGISNFLDESLAGVLSNTKWHLSFSGKKLYLMYEYIWLTHSHTLCCCTTILAWHDAFCIILLSFQYWCFIIPITVIWST
jgi:hypothetical protein